MPRTRLEQVSHLPVIASPSFLIFRERPSLLAVSFTGTSGILRRLLQGEGREWTAPTSSDEIADSTMNNRSIAPDITNQDNSPWLPPGFRFHPTDEELVVYYLTNKVVNGIVPVHAISDVDLNKCEPWDLPGMNFQLLERSRTLRYRSCLHDMTKMCILRFSNVLNGLPFMILSRERVCLLRPSLQFSTRSLTQFF